MLTYAGICIGIFKIFRISINAYTLLTAVLGGVFLIGAILIGMNYNHPFSSQGRFYYNTTPLTPLVTGKVIEAPLRGGDRVKAGDTLFRLDPTHYQAQVDSAKAALAAAEKSAAALVDSRHAAEAKVASAQAMMERARESYERVSKLGAGAVSKLEIDNQHGIMLSSAATLDSAKAELEVARLAEQSQIHGVNTGVALRKAELADAEFKLEQTVMRAPTDGTVEQSFLREGMMAAQLPLRPVMVFQHDEPATFAAAFLQNSAQRIKVGYKAEVVFPAVPGRIFHAKVKRVQNAIAQGQLQPNASMLSPEEIVGEGRLMVILEFDDPKEMARWQLVPGSFGIVAIYSEHLEELSVIRKVLMRMKSWTNFLFSDGH